MQPYIGTGRPVASQVQSESPQTQLPATPLATINLTTGKEHELNSPSQVCLFVYFEIVPFGKAQ